MANLGKTLMRLPRSYKQGDVIEVKAMVIHPNHNGRRRLEDGRYVAEHYVHTIEVYYGDTQIIAMRPSSALSENPYFTFKLKADRAAPIRVVWKDTDGQEYTHSVDVSL